MNAVKRALSRVALWATLPVTVLAFWWYATRSGDNLFFPPPAVVFEAFQHNWLFDLIGVHVVPSLARMFAGLVAGVVLGVAFGVALGVSDVAYRATKPWLALLRSLPGPTIIVMFLALFGDGFLTQVLMIAFVSLFPVLLNTIDGVRGTEPVLLDVARSYRFTWWQRIYRVIVPSAMPQISVGVLTSSAIAFIVMIVSEYFGGTDGIGYFTRDAATGFDMPDLWSGMVLLGLLGVGLNALVSLIQRPLLRWYVASRAQANRS